MPLSLDTITPADLPAPPQAAIEIMRACSDIAINNQELANIARTDPVLSAELLRVVNSPFFGMARKISHIGQAISILGHKALRNMVLCISVRDAIDPKKLPGFDLTGFWEDTLRRATAGRLLAPIAAVDEEECFTACLLQDFGLLVMFYLNPAVKADWSQFISLDPEGRYRVEREAFGVTHDQVSLMLAQQWSLPRHFSQAIGFHHRYTELDDSQESGAALCRVLHCADWLCALFSAHDKAAVLQQVKTKLASMYGLSEQHAVNLLNQIPGQVEEAADALGLHVQTQVDFDQVVREANVRLAEENTSYQELTWKLEKAIKERDELAAALAKELELAAEIQRSLLPSEQEARFPVYGVNIPALELSGDFFDYFKQDDGSILFNLGDVSGKGVTASLLMAKTSSLFHCLGKRENDLGRLMAQINAEICETSVRGMFVAMVAGKYTPASGQVQIVNAGNPPVLFLQEDKKIKKIEAGAPPLGIVEDAEFPVVEFALGKGHLLMFSDGVTEGYIAEGQEMGVSGLLGVIKRHIDQSPRKQLAAILEQFKYSTGGQRDDITVMVLEHCGQGLESLLSYEFSSKPAELQSMRRQVRQVLTRHRCNKACVDRLILAVNEAAMNVIQHAYNFDSSGQIRIDILQKENELIFKLTDFACPIDRSCVKSRDLNELRPGGLGVHFMNEIMDEVKFQDDCKSAGNILLMRKKLDESCLKPKGGE